MIKNIYPLFECSLERKDEMTERVLKMNQNLMNSFIGKKIEEAFNAQGNGLTEEIIDLYVYIIDAQGPDELSAIGNQYRIVEEVLNNNLSNYKDIYDNVEAFLRKILYVSNIDEYNKLDEKKPNGLKDMYKCMGLIDEDYDNKSASGAKFKLYKIYKAVCHERNVNTHTAPSNDPSTIAEIIWKSLFVELWVIRQYADSIIKKRDSLSDEEYEKILMSYCEYQIQAYEKVQDAGFTYIQIEYENTVDPNNDNAQLDGTVIKGTADTVLSTINFEETPSVKLVAEAGMGKTKMLEYINYKLCSDFKNGIEKVVPVFFVCNDTQGDIVDYQFEKSIYEKMKKILNQINAGHIPETGFLKYLLKNYKVMFLLDGLNELNRGIADKKKFIKSLLEYIKKDNDKRCYFLMTERYSRGAVTITNRVVYYKLSEISEVIKKEFFSAKGAEVLFKRLQIISEQYDVETRKELNSLLKRPFFLSVFCELSDSLANVDDKRMPATKLELMDYFVKMLIERENSKGEIAANYMYIKFYLLKLAELNLSEDRILLSDVLKGFAEVTTEYGLNNQDYSSNHIIELFEQLGFINCSDNKYIYVDDVYAEYMEELLLESL
jgi:hypothetical protein